MNTSTAHYQGKVRSSHVLRLDFETDADVAQQPFPDELHGLSGGITSEDSVKEVRTSANQDVDTTTLQGHASHELRKGGNPPTGIVSTVEHDCCERKLRRRTSL